MFEGGKVRRNSKLVEEHRQCKYLHTVDRNPVFSGDGILYTSKEA